MLLLIFFFSKTTQAVATGEPPFSCSYKVRWCHLESTGPLGQMKNSFNVGRLVGREQCSFTSSSYTRRAAFGAWDLMVTRVLAYRGI